MDWYLKSGNSSGPFIHLRHDFGSRFYIADSLQNYVVSVVPLSLMHELQCFSFLFTHATYSQFDFAYGNLATTASTILIQSPIAGTVTNALIYDNGNGGASVLMKSVGSRSSASLVIQQPNDIVGPGNATLQF